MPMNSGPRFAYSGMDTVSRDGGLRDRYDFVIGKDITEHLQQFTLILLEYIFSFSWRWYCWFSFGRSPLRSPRMAGSAP